jgi:hypothetical protein
MVVALAAIVGIVVTSCSNNTELFTNVLFKNNTTSEVIFDRCTNINCGKILGSVPVSPGRSISVANDPDGKVRSAKLLHPDGTEIGCLPFRFTSTPTRTIVVSESTAVPCGMTGGERFTRGKTWPTSAMRIH